MNCLRRATIAGAAAVAVLSAAAIARQTTPTAILTGAVIDQRCAALPGASVTVRQLAGELTRTASTDRDGTFSVGNLPAGDYAVHATRPGFVAATRTAIGLNDGDTVSSSLVLEPDSPTALVAGSTTCVPVQMSRGVMIVRGRINADPDPVWLILDSGASVSVVADALAKARGIAARSTGDVRGGIGEGSARIGMIGPMAVSVAGARIDTINTVSIPLGEEFGVIDHAVDGVLGSDAFLKFVVRIDYAAASVTFFDAASFVYQGSGATVPLTLSGNTPNVPVSVQTNGKTLAANAELDTGSDGAIGLNRPFVDAHHLLDGRPTVAGFAMGVGGEASIVVGRVDALGLGPFALAQPVVGFSRATQGATASKNMDGILGSAVLRRFTVFLDYPHRRVVLEPNASLNDRFDLDMSGLVLARNGRGPARVLSVRPDTPASQAAIRVGDEIVSIDGRATAGLPLDTLSRWFRVPDRDYRLGLRRAGQAFEIAIRTKRLI